MRIAFFSNYLNHHQLPFCLAMDRLTEGNFTFVATRPVPESRLKLGYLDMDKQFPFVLKTYDDPAGEEKALQLAESSDIVIVGSAPEIYVQRRMVVGKLTFRYAERLYKKSYLSMLSPYGRKQMRQDHKAYKEQPLYMLCASNYTAGDFGLSGAYIGKTFRWGYFPEVKKADPDQLWAQKNAMPKPTILWAGRMIDWKHPEAAVKVAAYLKKHGYDFHLHMIGTGDMHDALQQMIRTQDLQDCVQLLGAMPPEQVRAHMEQSDIFLFTSDRREGWGAVLNEAMNSGCAVVASRAIGAVGFLIKHGENGIIYQDGKQKQLNATVKKLLDEPTLRKRLGKAAYQTLADTWNADVAAQRLLALTEALSKGEQTPFADGPCSVAERIYNYDTECGFTNP